MHLIGSLLQITLQGVIEFSEHSASTFHESFLQKKLF